VLKEPALSLAYKPFIGTEWPLQSPANNAANGQKRITSIDSLFLPSGIETLALRVRVRYDRDGDGNLDPNLEVFQYFDRGGLVKIEWTAYDVMMHDPATNSQKRGTYHETTWLTGQFED
jgi:hypothetical protein